MCTSRIIQRLARSDSNAHVEPAVPAASLAPSTHAVATVAKVSGELRRRRFGPAIPLARSRSGAGGR